MTMDFKSDLELWHKIREFAETLARVAKLKETDEIFNCEFYEFDEASEENCHCPQISRESSEFNSDEECWKCPHRKERVKRRKR